MVLSYHKSARILWMYDELMVEVIHFVISKPGTGERFRENVTEEFIVLQTQGRIYMP